MSIAIATKGKFPVPPGQAKKSDADTAPYADGGGTYNGALPLEEKKRLKINVTYLRVNISEQEEPKLTISPIKVSDD